MASHSTKSVNIGARLDRLPNSGWHIKMWLVSAFALLVCWSNGIGGALTVLLGTKCFAFVMPGITSLPVYADTAGGIKNLALMTLCIASTWVLGAVISWILGGKIAKKTAE